MHRRFALALACAALVCALCRTASADDGGSDTPADSPATETPASDSCADQAGRSPAADDALSRFVRRSTCEEGAGRLVDAIRDAEVAVKIARRRRAFPVEKALRGRLANLTARVPKLTLSLPSDVDALTIAIDGRPQPITTSSGALSVDPGRHTIHAEGVKGGRPVAFDRSFEAREGERVELTVNFPAAAPALRPEQLQCVLHAATPRDAAACLNETASATSKGRYLTADQLSCLRAAKDEEEARRCLPDRGSNLSVRASLEASGYSDTNHVNVFSPTVTGSVASPTEGWNFGGGYTVDFVSAASPDIVSEASPPFHEVRHAGTLSGGYKPALFGAQATADVSSEPDYLSIGGGLALTVDLDEKQVTPRLGVNYSHDTIGRSTTPFSVFHHTLDTVELEAGTTVVMSPTSILLVGGTVQVERGDQSKPYRYVPMFDPATADRVRPGQSIASVNAARMSIRPLEQLPTTRERYALGFRFAHRFPPATLRLEERLYVDSWRQTASTTDARLMADVSGRLRLWPHARLNAQSAVDFYRLAYSAAVDGANNAVTVPTYRTGDRELGPMMTITGGAGARLLVTAPSSLPALALTLQVDAIYSRFFDSLFVTSRTALYGTLGIEGEFL